MNKCYLIHYEPYSLKIVKDYLREINQTVQVERVALADLYKQHKDAKEKKKKQREKENQSELKKKDSSRLEGGESNKNK